MNDAISQRSWLSVGSSTRWLAWKEACQLGPLVASLVMIVGILWMIQSSMWQTRIDAYYGQLEQLFLILPVVFATGAGAILVGFEREQGTLAWMAMLPMSLRRLVLTKIGVAAIALAVVWVFATILIACFGVDRPFGSRFRLDDASVQLQGIHLVAWIVRTFFILTVSFYTGWKIRNPFLSLVVLVAIMFAPSLIVWALLGGPQIEDWIGQTREIRLTLAVLVFSTCWFAVAGYRNAMTALSPTKSSIWNPAEMLGKVGTAITGKHAYHFENSFAALLWQSLRGMVWAWAVNMLLITYVLCSLILIARNGYETPAPAFLAILSGVAASWLGVSVFKFAGSPNSLRQLCVMGASPMRVYLARHAVPIAIMSSGIVGYTLLLTVVLREPLGHQEDIAEWLPSVRLVCLSVGSIYVISQWISQCIRTTVLAYLVAPMVSFAFVMSMLGGPPIPRTLFPQLSVLAFIGWMFVFMAVTCWLMKRYMLGTDRTRSVVAAVLVVIVFQFGVVRRNSKEAAKLQDVRLVGLQKSSDQGIRTEPILIQARIPDWYELVNQLDVDEWGRQRELLKSQLDAEYLSSMSLLKNVSDLAKSPGTPAQMETSVLGGIVKSLMFERMSFRASYDERYYETLRDVAMIVAGLRRSDRWLDQESADRIEVYLADTLGDTDLGIDESDARIAGALRSLPSIKERNQARKNAILNSYGVFQSLPAADVNTPVGGMFFDPQDQSVVGSQGSSKRRDRIASIVIGALDAIDSPSQPGVIQPWQVALHEQTVYGAVPLEWGPYSDRHRNQLPTIATIPPGYFRTALFPVRYVGLPWERQIETLQRAAQ